MAKKTKTKTIKTPAATKTLYYAYDQSAKAVLRDILTEVNSYGYLTRTPKSAFATYLDDVAWDEASEAKARKNGKVYQITISVQPVEANA